MSNISREPYKGVRDFFPEDMAIQNYIFDTWRKTAQDFGYVEYGASILEPAELYRAKSGEEIVNEQMYVFTDKGGREVALRPEMTPTVARMVAARHREYKKPMRWFSIPNLFRYERPQKGRLREHWQLNCDMFGLEGIEAEVEIISLAVSVMDNFGIDRDAYSIRINDRSLVERELEKLNLHENQKHEIQKLMDKKEKIDDFENKAIEIVGKPFEYNPEPSSAITELMNELYTKNITHVTFDPYLMRGFDYYTGIVFEIFDKHPENNRSLFGGGRYDNLLEMFGKEKMTAVGFGMGDVMLREVLLTYDLLPEELKRKN